MKEKNSNLHGNAPDESRVALLIIDMINDLEFPDGDKILDHAISAARNIRQLKERCRQAGIPVIYVNDNFGKWQSNFNKIVERCLKPEMRGKPLAELLMPDEHDYFVLKPKHSGFYSSSLDILLNYLGTVNVIITGITADICVYFTASDAYMRDLNVIIPKDCVACVEPRHCAHTLEQARRILKADITPSAELELEALISGNATCK